MNVFSEYERKVIEILVARHLPPETIVTIVKNAVPVSHEHTDIGYFVTVRHPLVPQGRRVCADPSLIGRFREGDCGFVCFLENGELTIECRAWDDGLIPEDIRTRIVTIERAAEKRAV